MISHATCLPTNDEVTRPPIELLVALQSQIVDHAIDTQRQRIYVVPKSASNAGTLLHNSKNWGPWQLQLVKCIPVTAAGVPDVQRLDAFPFVDDEIVQACQSTLGDDSQAVAIAREYCEPPILLLEREAHARQSPSSAPCEPEMAAAEIARLPLAHTRGPRLDWQGPDHSTLVEALRSHAVASAGITYVEGGRERFESYADLLSAAKQVLYGLQKLGLKQGDPLPLQITDRREHFHVFWGCALGGILPVTIAVPPRYEAGHPVFQKLVGVWKLLGARHVLASPDNVGPLRELLPTDATVSDVAKLDRSDEGHSAELSPDDVLFFQLTSGSTGTPKCIPETHGAVIAHVKHSAAHVGYSADDRTLNWLPFDHVVPMLTFHLKDVYLGCHAFHVPTAEVLADPRLWLDLMERHRINYSWSPNFGFKLVSTAARGRQTDSGGNPPSWDLGCVKRLMNAGEQVTATVCDEFLRATDLASHVMQPAFGMAEVATCMTYANDYGEPASLHRVLKSTLPGVLREADHTTPDSEVLPLVDLGPPSPGVEIRITARGDDRVLRENQVGHLQIRGPCVMPGYYRNPEANAESFVGDGWFDSGDLGFITDGRLVLTGRAKEMIIVRGANFYAYEIEDHVAELTGCRPTFVAATSVHSEASGTEGLVIFFVPDPATVPDGALANLSHGVLHPALKRLVNQIHSRVASSFGVNPDYVIPLPESGFLKTTSGKIQRNTFKQRFVEGGFRDVCRTLRRGISQHGSCVPDWFGKPVWQRRNTNGGSFVADGVGQQVCTLVFQHDSNDLSKRLGAVNLLGTDSGSLDRMRQMVHARQDHVVRIVYALPCDQITAEVQSDFASDLIAIGQSLVDVQTDVELYVVTRGAFQLDADDISTPEQLARSVCLAGIAKAISTELPRIRKSVHIDVDDALIQAPDAFTAALQAEMINRSADQEIALRRGARHVRRYSRAGDAITSEISSAQRDERYFQAESAYVVTGGLGGIGVDIVKQILDVPGTAVLVIGRRENVSEQLVEQGWQGTGDGSRVGYCAIDLGQDADELTKRVRSFVDRCGKPLAGVVHLAGHFQREDVAQLSSASFRDAVRAKIQGSLHLHRALKAAGTAEPLQFLHFGSVASLLAGHGLAAYSAACRFQEEFAVFQQADGVDSRVFCWSIWEDTGVGARDKALGFAPWVCPLSRSQGLSLVRKLADFTSQAALTIGANLRHPDLARLSADDDELDFHSLCVFHACDASIDVARAERAAGKVNYVDLLALPERQGVVDKNLLQTANLKSLAANQQAGPQNKTEETLFAVWKRVLGISQLNRHDNFFELGGDSLSWMNMTNQFCQASGVQIDATRIMQHATVAELADYATHDAMADACPPITPAADTSSDLLVTLKSGSQATLPPAFLFPTIAGTTSCFNELLSHVQAKVPFIGIGDPYLKGDRLSRLLRFDQWMQRYADAIQSRQPTGPYTLISYSQGSTWLWGTAEQLIHRGEVVDQCILLDPFFPAWNGGQQGFDWLAKWVRTIYRRIPRFVLKTAVKRVMSHMMGLDGPMQTERQREVSLAKAYQRYTGYRENIWLYVLFMEMDTGLRLLENYGELRHYPRDQYEDALDFLFHKSAERLGSVVNQQYLKDLLHMMAFAFLRASTFRPQALPPSTKVLVVAPERKGMSLARETQLDRLTAPGSLREIDVPLEAFDKDRHITGKLRRLYRPFELHYRCMHDPRFIAESVGVFQSCGIALG